MKNIFFAKTTMKHMFAGFFVALAISITAAIWTKNETEKQIDHSAIDRMSTIVTQRAKLLEEKAKQQNGTISMLARFLENDSKKTTPFLLSNQKLDNFFGSDMISILKQNGLSNIFIIDTNGNIIKSLQNSPDRNSCIFNNNENRELQELFKNSISSPESVRSNFFYSHENKTWLGLVAHRFVSTGGKSGVVAGTIDPKIFYEITTNPISLGKSGEVVAFVKNSESTIIYMTPSRFGSIQAYQTKPSPQNSPSSKALRKEFGAGVVSDTSNKELVSAWQFVPILGWGIVASIEQDELLSEWRQSSLIMDAIFSLSAIIIILLLFVLYHKIATPIKKLTKGANSLAHGQYNTKIELQSSDEFGILAVTFNKMATRIKNDHDRLLGKKTTLEEQTREIERLNRILKIQVDQKSTQISRYLEVIDSSVITSSTDTNGIITSVSSAFCRISGYSSEELIGKKHGVLRHPDIPSAVYEDMWQTITAGKTWRGELKNLAKDGSTYWVKTTISLDMENNTIIGYTSVEEDITDKKHIEELSITDPLTGLFNRRHFNTIIPEELNRARRDSKTVGLLVIDIDHFKQYNDTFGHQAGDDVIQKVALVLNESSKRAGEYAFRLGGEEFAIFFSIPDKNQAMQFAQNIRESVSNQAIEHPKNGTAKVITVSIGLALCDGSSNSTMESLYKKADINLYKAKANGRNTVVD